MGWASWRTHLDREQRDGGRPLLDLPLGDSGTKARDPKVLPPLPTVTTDPALWPLWPLCGCPPPLLGLQTHRGDERSRSDYTVIGLRGRFKRLKKTQTETCDNLDLNQARSMNHWEIRVLKSQKKVKERPLCMHTLQAGQANGEESRFRWYLTVFDPLLGGIIKSGLVKPMLLLVPPKLWCRLEALEDGELMSPRSPEVTELLPVRQGEMSLSNTWQSTTGSSLSWNTRTRST